MDIANDFNLQVHSFVGFTSFFSSFPEKYTFYTIYKLDCSSTGKLLIFQNVSGMVYK